jgi:hypothetical protein
VVFGATISQAYIEVVQLFGNNLSTPIQSNGTLTAGGSNTSATANLSSVVSSSDPELVFFSGATSSGGSAPTSSLSAINNLNNYATATNGAEGVYYGAPPQSSGETLTLGTASYWGTIALEING